VKSLIGLSKNFIDISARCYLFIENMKLFVHAKDLPHMLY